MLLREALSHRGCQQPSLMGPGEQRGLQPGPGEAVGAEGSAVNPPALIPQGGLGLGEEPPARTA